MLIGSFDTQLFIQHLLLESRLESLDRTEMLLSEVKKSCALTEDQHASIWIALTEAVTNAICHGNKCDPSRTVSLSAELKSERLSALP